MMNEQADEKAEKSGKPRGSGPGSTKGECEKQQPFIGNCRQKLEFVCVKNYNGTIQNRVNFVTFHKNLTGLTSYMKESGRSGT